MKKKKSEFISTIVLIFLMILQAFFLFIGFSLILLSPPLGLFPTFQDNDVDIINSNSCLEVEKYWRPHFDEPFILISSCDNYNISFNESLEYSDSYGGFLSYDKEKDIFYANFSKNLTFRADKSNNYTLIIPIKKEGLNENSTIKIGNIHLEENKDYGLIYLLLTFSPTIIWFMFYFYKKYLYYRINR